MAPPDDNLRDAFAIIQWYWLGKVPKKEKAREILLYERKTLKVIVEMITGHFRLRKYPNQTAESMEEETAHHIVCECPAI